MRIALLFIDGVGMGERDAAKNPLARGDFLLSQFADGAGVALPLGGERFILDTTFGVPGRPQSASNQTALLTGEAAPQLMGRHVLGFPNAPLRALLDARSIAKRMVASGLRADFANGYPAGYLDALGLARRPSAAAEVTIPDNARRRLRPSATTAAMAAANVALRTFDDIRSDTALTHDIVGHRGRAHGFSLPNRTPAEAVEIFWQLGAQTDFLLFEHFLADEAGHAQDAPLAFAALSTFDEFARGVVANRPADAGVMIVSDHGNVEDLSTRSHTLNTVAALWFGPARAPLGATPKNLAELGNTLLTTLGVNEATQQSS
ncbi:MAG: metalloenzyme [Myxococcaceae bacterium]